MLHIVKKKKREQQHNSFTSSESIIYLESWKWNTIKTFTDCLYPEQTDRDRAKTTNSDEISALWRTHLSSFYDLSKAVVNGRKWHKVSKPAPRGEKPPRSDAWSTHAFSVMCSMSSPERFGQLSWGRGLKSTDTLYSIAQMTIWTPS